MRVDVIISVYVLTRLSKSGFDIGRINPNSARICSTLLMDFGIGKYALDEKIIGVIIIGISHSANSDAKISLFSLLPDT